VLSDRGLDTRKDLCAVRACRYISIIYIFECFHAASLIILLEIVDQVDHFRLRHGGTHSSICFVQNPEGEDDPQAIEECKVQPTAAC
jgi:hypothetical protein